MGDSVYTSPARGPVNYYKMTIRDLGWEDVEIGVIVDDKSRTKQLAEWPGFVKEGTKRARQQTWKKAAKNKPHCKGLE
eukprot:16327511-Heterocapsa_arctica.AAC.1